MNDTGGSHRAGDLGDSALGDITPADGNETVQRRQGQSAGIFVSN